MELGLGWLNSAVWMVSPSYYYLIEYLVGLSSAIVAFVTVVIFFQIFMSGMGVVDGDNKPVEFFWTIIPSILVSYLCFMNLEFLDETFVESFCNTIKVIGRQWYWSYGIPCSDVMYDSVITDFVDGVDKPLRVDYGKSYTFYVTSADVIHSFSVPFLGIKVDAIPGRVNSFFFNPDSLGSHVGYCAELCGAGHAYMPIVIEVVY